MQRSSICSTGPGRGLMLRGVFTGFGNSSGTTSRASRGSQLPHWQFPVAAPSCVHSREEFRISILSKVVPVDALHSARVGRVPRFLPCCRCRAASPRTDAMRRFRRRIQLSQLGFATFLGSLTPVSESLYSFQLTGTMSLPASLVAMMTPSSLDAVER